MEAGQAKLGVPVPLRQDCLPTKKDIINHYLNLRRVQQEAGEWHTSLAAMVKMVVSDVKKQWDKTEIPHMTLETRKGEKDISGLLAKFQSMSKVALNKRGVEFGHEFDSIYDVADCPHQNPCCCPLEHQVYCNFDCKLNYSYLDLYRSPSPGGYS